jgi:hypothetical protein
MDDYRDALLFRGRQVLDGLVYAVVLTAVVMIVSAVISFVLGGAWVGVKYLMFLVGMGMFGLATLKLRPTPPWKDADRLPANRRGKTPLQAAMANYSPIDMNHFAPNENDRLSDGVKLFLASLLVLLVSFAMEAVFGVAL